MAGRLADTQSCYQQQNAGSLPASSAIPEPKKAEIVKEGISMDAETNQPCQPQTVAATDTAQESITLTPPKVETNPYEDRDSETEALINFYSCCKLSFMIKMASLQNVKALGYALSEEEVKREQECMEDARIKALEAWQQIQDSGITYDAVGYEYLRSCALHSDEGIP